jgi:hypothetical protein
LTAAYVLWRDTLIVLSLGMIEHVLDELQDYVKLVDEATSVEVADELEQSE